MEMGWVMRVMKIRIAMIAIGIGLPQLPLSIPTVSRSVISAAQRYIVF
jgi:hypothetical protein